MSSSKVHFSVEAHLHTSPLLSHCMTRFGPFKGNEPWSNKPLLIHSTPGVAPNANQYCGPKLYWGASNYMVVHVWAHTAEQVGKRKRIVGVSGRRSTQCFLPAQTTVGEQRAESREQRHQLKRAHIKKHNGGKLVMTLQLELLMKMRHSICAVSWQPLYPSCGSNSFVAITKSTMWGFQELLFHNFTELKWTKLVPWISPHPCTGTYSVCTNYTINSCFLSGLSVKVLFCLLFFLPATNPLKWLKIVWICLKRTILTLQVVAS